MKQRFTVLGVTVVATLVAATAALTATAAPGVTVAAKPFTATFTGRAIVRATGDTTADISAKGKGKGNVLGVATITGTGTGLAGEPCNAFSGKGTMVSRLGKLNFTVASGAQACASASDANVNALTGKATITGGTMKLAKAKGTLNLTGTYNRGTGTFTATFKGVIRM